MDIDEITVEKIPADSSLSDLDAEFYGDESFNDDEFDMEGFEDMPLEDDQR